MLALSRKVGETIVIGDNVEITVLDIQRDQIKLGISAPRNISIHRKEIYIQIQEENKAAMQSTDKAAQQLKDFMK